MKPQAIICLLLVVIVYCVNKCACHGGTGWAKSFSSSSASSSASSYSSSFFSGDPSQLKNFKPPVATAFASANAQAGIGGATAGAKATASSRATANTESNAKADAHSETYSNDQVTISANSALLPGTDVLHTSAPQLNGATAGANSGSLTGGIADVHHKDETGTQASSDGAIITNAIAGAYAPTQVKINEVKSSSGSKNGYYSNDFVLPSRDTDTDYDSEENTTHEGSNTKQKGPNSSVSDATSTANSLATAAHTKTPNVPFKSATSHDLSGSITANTHLKGPLVSTTKYSFPGPSGSIYDYKPAPPGGGGPDKAWLVTPITTGTQKAAQVSSVASSIASSHAGTVGLTQNLISSFPGSLGSIYDSKPVHGAAPSPVQATGCSGNSCSYPSQSHDTSSVYPSPNIQVGCSGTYCSTAPAIKPSLIPGPGCSHGTSCGTQTYSSGSSTSSGLNSVLGILPGSSGSIYDSKPVHGAAPSSAQATGCSGNSCSYPSQSHDTPSVHPSPNFQVGCSGTYCSTAPATKPSHIPGSGCSPGTSCGTQTSSTGISTSSDTVLGILPGSSGSIYESKPVPSGSPGCYNGQCTGQSPSGSYKPITQGTATSNDGFSHSGLVTGSTSLHNNKDTTSTTSTSESTGCFNGQCNSGTHKPNNIAPSNTGYVQPVPSPVSVGSQIKPVSTGSSGCFNNQCNGQLTGSYKPASEVVVSSNVGSTYDRLPGGSGSIYDSKPANGVSNVGTNAQSNADSAQGTYQSGYTDTAHNVLSDTSGSYYSNKPIISSGTASPGSTGQIQSDSYVNPGLPNIIQTLPGKQESIYTSKPSSSVTANANAYANANANTATLTGGPCSGSSCTYPDNSGKQPSFGTSGCSGSSCNTRPIYSSKPFIPVGIISDEPYGTKPNYGTSNCKGSSCGGHIAVKPKPILAPPVIGAIPSSVHGCLGSSCTNGVATTGQTSSAGSNASSGSQSSTGIESVKETSPQSSYVSQPSPPCSPGSLGCSKPVEGNLLYSNGNGVIAGPGTGNLPVDESSSGSYLGLAVPTNTNNVKPVSEPSQDVNQSSGCSGSSCTYPADTSLSGTGNQVYNSGLSGANGVSSSIAGSNTGTYQPGTYQPGASGSTQTGTGCSSGGCGSGSSSQSGISGAGSHSNNANGYATGSVIIQSNDGLLFPGADNRNSYGTEKPGVACTTSSCGSHLSGSSQKIPGGCSGGNCGSYISNPGAIASSGSRYDVPKLNCPNGGCTSSSGPAGAGGVTFGFGGNFDKTGSYGNSGSYSSAVSSAGSGVDLGPLAHFFGTKGASTAGAFANAGGTANTNAAANAGSFSSSGSFAKSGSFASSFSSSSAGSY